MIKAEMVLDALDSDKFAHTVLLYNDIIYSSDEFDRYLSNENLAVTDMQSVPIFGSYVIVIKAKKAGDPDGKEQDS